ncbi:hypothetical protein EUX98_g9489 [Antrodiella citrinella]|uniref:Copper-fist domain-containing protein n=1 Tax=Antrodiella citrinella TaxID=2447956 RepID=A0A4V3XEX3_9APHY|nr:hypothetical protein EUX98_g9489 [Antrodiella citrinella]
MVFLGDKKYACETCIKGHRSSSCKHTDRPLFEIKKKGRPVTQCEHCRELRKTKQVHVKCSCENKEDSDGGPSSSTKGVKRPPASAAFPSGLPEALEATVALQRLGEGSPSGSSPGTPPNTCDCKVSGSCDCCTPRVSSSQSKKQGKERAAAARSDDGVVKRDSEEPIAGPGGLVAIANGGHHRPVLPRPSPQRQSSPSGPVHDPSQPDHPHASRHQAHSEHFYSPYGRAYDHAHGAELVSSEPSLPAPVPESTVASSVYSSSEELYADPLRDDAVEPPPPWSDSSSPALPDFVPSLCGCGPNCACPGCFVHRGSAAQPGANTCLNPNDCTACFECNFLSTSLPSLAPGTSSFPDATDAQYQSIDEWVRQLGVASGFNANDDQTDSNRDQAPSTSVQPYADQRDIRYDSALWQQAYALWGIQDQGQSNAPASASECCGGRCQCGTGMCTCAADCCGCCTGCQCSECDHPDNVAGGASGSKTLTFAESGIRENCSGSTQKPHPQSPRLGGSSFVHSSQPVASGSRLRSDSYGYNASASMTVPRTVSRASSTSSHASSRRSRSSSSSRGSAHVPASGNPAAVRSRHDVASSSSPQPPPPRTGTNAAGQHRTLNSDYDFVL